MQTQSTILIVDDDRDMRWAMSNNLSDAGFGVAESDGGGAALEHAAKDPPAAVLLDMHMPGLSGDVVLRSLKRLNPQLPIIIVTAHGSIPGAVSAMQDGGFRICHQTVQERSSPGDRSASGRARSTHLAANGRRGGRRSGRGDGL